MCACVSQAPGAGLIRGRLGFGTGPAIRGGSLAMVHRISRFILPSRPRAQHVAGRGAGRPAAAVLFK